MFDECLHSCRSNPKRKKFGSNFFPSVSLRQSDCSPDCEQGSSEHGIVNSLTEGLGQATGPVDVPDDAKIEVDLSSKHSQYGLQTLHARSSGLSRGWGSGTAKLAQPCGGLAGCLGGVRRWWSPGFFVGTVVELGFDPRCHAPCGGRANCLLTPTSCF